MAWKKRKGCSVCDLIEIESKGKQIIATPVYSRINKIIAGTMSVQHMAEEYEGKLSYNSIRNHSKKHQYPGEGQLANAKLLKLKQKSQIVTAKEIVHHSERRTSALRKLEEMMEAGELKGGTYTAMAQLLKQEADIEEKAKDRSFEIMKMMSAFQSGEVKRFGNTADRLTDSPN